MTHSETARRMLAILCGAQGFGALAVDLNRTHATNPQWPRHARFHLVWQATSYALLSLLETALILAPGPFRVQRFYLAAVLASIPMLSCLAAFAWRKSYGGTPSPGRSLYPAASKIALRIRTDIRRDTPRSRNFETRYARPFFRGSLDISLQPARGIQTSAPRPVPGSECRHTATRSERTLNAPDQ
jgi:hypothetical protein